MRRMLRLLCAVLSLSLAAAGKPAHGKRVTAPKPRLWPTVGNEGVLGSLPGAQRKQLNALVQRAGGLPTLLKTLSLVTVKVKSDSIALLDTLGSIFKTPTYLGGANSGDNWLDGWTVGFDKPFNP